jgi:hypothetical protein
MPAGTSILAALAAVAAIGFTAGCGSDDSAKKSKPDPLTQAKATMSKDCQEGKASDKPLCDCIADKLAAIGNNAEQLLALDKRVNDGETVSAVNAAATKCSAFAAK